MSARARMLAGERLTFDEEARALYDATPPHFSDAHFDSLLARLDSLVPGREPLGAPIPAVSRPAADPRDAGGHRLPDRHRGLPGAHAGASAAAAGGALRPRVREGHLVERLQLVQGRIPQPHPGEPRLPDSGRPRDRPRLPRRISRPSRLQRPAGGGAGAGPRLARVLGVSAVQRPVAHRGGERQLRHRDGVSVGRADRVRARFAVSAGGTRPFARGRNAAVREVVERLNYARNEVARRFLDGQIDSAGARAAMQRYWLITPEPPPRRFASSTPTAATSSTTTWDATWWRTGWPGPAETRRPARWAPFGTLLSAPYLQRDFAVWAVAARLAHPVAFRSTDRQSWSHSPNGAVDSEGATVRS